MGGVSGKSTPHPSTTESIDSLDGEVGRRLVLTRSTADLRHFNSKGLPDEVLLMLMNLLPEGDLIRLTLLCKTWR